MNAESTLTLRNTDFEQLTDFESLLKEKLPHRTNKYYQILLSARELLIEPSFKFHTTVDPIISEINTTRPTWYSYFRSIEHYYREVVEVNGDAMIEYTLKNLEENVTFGNWINMARELRMEVFLSNTRVLTGYFTSLYPAWNTLHERLIKGYATILGPVLQLSPSRILAFVKNTSNEMILHPDLYYKDPVLFHNYVRREYALFLADQND